MTQQQAGRTSAPEIPSWPKALTRGLVDATKGLLGKQPEDHDGIDGSVRTVATAFLSNLVVAVAKWVAFLISGSSALMAESVHSTAVTVNQGLLLRGRLTSRRPATPEHPFGFGRVRYFWAFVVAVVMFGLGAVVSVGRGVIALTGGEEHAITRPYIPLAGLTVGLLMDGWSFLTARRQAKREKGEQSYWQYVTRTRNPEVPLVLMEDSAALTSLAFAYTGVALAIITGNGLWDALASIAVGMVLAVVSWILAREMRSLLIGESATPEVEDTIREILTGHPEVRGVIYFRTLHLGPGDLLVEAKVCFDEQMRFPDIARVIDELEDGIRERVDIARLVSIEPDVAERGDVEVPAYQRSRADGGTPP